METDTSLVRANGVVVLDTIAHVVLYLALVVDPGYAEREYAVGNAEALDKVVALKFGMFVVLILDSGYHFFYGLQVFRLVGESALEIR